MSAVLPRDANGTAVEDSELVSSSMLVAAALEATLRARAPGLQASTQVVHALAVKVGRQLKLDQPAQALLGVAVRVRDIGMIALPDSLVLATNRLSPADWELMNRHPVIGAELLEGLPVVAGAATIVRAHHERWDGAGYPDGIEGDAIPLLSRVIAACDAFVAIATDRPYRRGIGAEAALEQVCQQSGSQFDTRVVDALVAALAADAPPRETLKADEGPVAVDSVRAGSGRVPRERRLATSIEQFAVVPAFAPAHERLLSATETGNITGGELVTGIECDTGLTLAVLRHAQEPHRAGRIANVADAVSALGADGVREAIAALPCAEFPWRTSQLEVLMHRSRVHAQAVGRAAERIAQEVEPAQRDDILAAALLHDIGKLVLGHAVPEYTGESRRTTTPEERLREERRAWGMDHASLGGLLLRRWGLPDRLANWVAAHHSSDAEGEVATYVRLADMVAHHAQGETVDSTTLLRLAHTCGLSATALRNVLFDLPQSGGSQRRRADRSPLSDRETDVIRILAQGKVYKLIAVELGVSVSTVRTHLHNAYSKLGVADRAQAVLRATEMGWL